MPMNLSKKITTLLNNTSINSMNNSHYSSYHALMPGGIWLVVFFSIICSILVGIIPGISISYRFASSPIIRITFLLIIVYFAVIEPTPGNFIISIVLAFIYIGAMVPGSLFYIIESRKRRYSVRPAEEYEEFAELPEIEKGKSNSLEKK